MEIHSSAAFGRAIRRRRKKLGYTQEYISDFTGISKSFISDLENGKETAEIGKSIRIADVLGMDIIMKGRNEL